MAEERKEKNIFILPPMLLSIFAFGGLGLLVSLTNYLDWGSYISEPIQISIYLPFFIFGVVGFFFFVLVEHKFNRLKIKSVLLYLGIIISLFNVLAVALLPNEITILEKTLIITPIRRAEYILCGFAFAFIPFVLFYMAPRKILSRHFINIFIIIILTFIFISILLCPIFDLEHFKNGEPIKSFFPYKNAFGLYLALGIFLSIILRIRTKKWWWLLLIIPFYIFLILSTAKIALVVSTLAIIIYVVIRLVQICKISKDNLIIVLLIIGLGLLVLSVFIIGIIYSDAGILKSIREYFIKALNTAKGTFDSRSVLWDSTFKLLSSYRIIFGYGISSFGPILNLLNSQVCPEFDRHITDSHNFIFETLGRGGIILLLIHIFLYVYLFRAIIKTRKYNYWLSVANIIFISLTLVIGMFESTSVALNLDFLFNLAVVIPIMSEYYISVDKDEIAHKNEILDNAEYIKNKQYKSKLYSLNKKRILFELKYIAYDLNKNFKL